METLLSQRAYAKHRGVSHTAVQKAVRYGRITTIDGKLDPDVADREWRENVDLTKPRNSVSGTPKLVRAPDAPSAAMLIDAPAAAVPLQRDVRVGAAAVGVAETIDETPDGSSFAPPPTSSARGYAQARAARETYEAKLAKAKYEQLMEQLVGADEVKVAAFNRARRTRDLLLALPDRLSAVLAAESDADEIHRILSEEITRCCEELSRAHTH
jgi:hypothetical protein